MPSASVGSPIGSCHRDTASCVGIPAKLNAYSEGNPNGIPGSTRTLSERSDAGISIVQEVFGFVKSESVRSEAEARWSWRGWGCGARGGSPLSPLQHAVTPSASSALGLSDDGDIIPRTLNYG